VLDLMAAARQLRPPLCALTYETFFGLLWCTGMRIGETIGLQRGDVDLSAGVITVREAKLDRARLVPLQQSATNTLTSYAASRDRLCPQPRSQTFFVSSRGTTLIPQAVLQTFHRLAVRTGLRTETKRLVSMTCGIPSPCARLSRGIAPALTSRRACSRYRRI